MDWTTGLFKPQELEERFRYEANRIDRYGPEKGLEMSLVFIRLHGLKEINQQLGWVAGDRVLLSMTQALRSTLRAVDAAARMGRTSYAVLLPETSLGNIPAVLGKIQEKLKAPDMFYSDLAHWQFGWTLYQPGSESTAFWNSFLSKNGVMKGWTSLAADCR